MFRKARPATGNGGEKQLRGILEVAAERAGDTQDKALVRDTGLLWQEMARIHNPIKGLSTGDLVLPDDWVERSAEERQRYMHAQLVVGAGRNYTDSGWQTLEGAVGFASSIRQLLEAQERARQAKEILEQALQKEPAVRELTASETRLKDLERRRAEVRRGDGDKTLDDVTQEKLRDLESEIEVAQLLLEQNKIWLSLVDRPEVDQLIRDASLKLLHELSKGLDTVRKGRAASAARQRGRRFFSRALIITVAIALFVLGKFSDLFYWWLALVAAAALWAANEVVARPFLRQIAAKRIRDGLARDIRKVGGVKIDFRLQQAFYNNELRKAGMGEVTLIPVANSSSEEIQPPAQA